MKIKGVVGLFIFSLMLVVLFSSFSVAQALVQCSDDSQCDDENSCTNDYCSDGVCFNDLEDDGGPEILDLLVDPYSNNGIFDISATVEDECSPIETAEYFLRHAGPVDCGDVGTGTEIYPEDDGSFDLDNLIEDVLAEDVEYLQDGFNRACVQAKDSSGNWGECSCYYYESDTLPPERVYNITLNGVSNAHELLVCGDDPLLRASVCDTESYIQGGEFFIDLWIPPIPAPWTGYWMSLFGDPFVDENGWRCANLERRIPLEGSEEGEVDLGNGHFEVAHPLLFEGTHFINVLRGKDSKENWGKIADQNLNISFIKDTTPPKTAKELVPFEEEIVECGIDEANGHAITDGCFYVKQGTEIELDARDFNPDNMADDIGLGDGYNNLPGEYAGDVVINYIVYWRNDSEDEWVISQSGQSDVNEPLTLTLDEDSYHLIEYWSTDGVCDNEEEHHFELDIVDTVAPETTREIIGPSYFDGDKTYLDGITQINLTCVDPEPHPVNDILLWWRYFVDGDPVGGWRIYNDPIVFQEESEHYLEYYCADALNNTEPMHNITYYVDHTKPVTNLSYGLPFVQSEGYAKWITSDTEVNLTATDDFGFNHDSGLNFMSYRVTLVDDQACWSVASGCSNFEGGGEWETVQSGSALFNINETSCHLIEYYSVDNVNKTEEMNKDCVFVDNDAPTTYKTVGEPKYPGEDPIDWWITQNTTITLECLDDDQQHPVDNVTLFWRDYLEGQGGESVCEGVPETCEQYSEDQCGFIPGCEWEGVNGSGDNSENYSIGEEIFTMNFPEGGGTGVGVAFDGEFLYYTYISSKNLYKIRPDGSGHEVISTSGIAEYGLGALSYDADRGLLWAGTYGCDQNYGGPVYLIDPATGVATYQFSVPSDYITYCLDDGIAYDALDDSIWYSDDVADTMVHIGADGTFLGTVDLDAIHADLADNSGIAIGGDNFYLGTDGHETTLRVHRDNLTILDTFVNTDYRIEDMECDPETYSPVEVMWIRDAYAGSARAYSIEPGTCGLGGQPSDEEQCVGVPEVSCGEIQSLGEANGYDDKCSETPGCEWEEGVEWNEDDDGYVEIQKGEDCLHVLEWYCEDRLGNSESKQIEYDQVDTAGPNVTRKFARVNGGDIIEGGSVGDETIISITNDDTIRLCADVNDYKQTGDPGVGVDKVWYRFEGLPDPQLEWNEEEQAYCVDLSGEGIRGGGQGECGSWSFKVKGYDLLGNEGDWTNGLEILVDNVPPIGEVLNPHSGNYYRDGVPFQVYAPAVDFGGDDLDGDENCPASGVAYCDFYAIDYNFEGMNQSEIKEFYWDLWTYFDQIGEDPNIVYLGRVPYENGVCKGIAALPEDSGMNDTVFLGVNYVDSAGNDENADVDNPDNLQLALNPWFSPITMNVDNEGPMVTVSDSNLPGPLTSSGDGDNVFVEAEVIEYASGFDNCWAEIYEDDEGELGDYVGVADIIGTGVDHNLCRINGALSDGLESGDYFVKVNANDEEFNIGSVILPLIVDNSRPSMSVVHPLQGEIYGDMFPVSLDVDDEYSPIVDETVKFRITEVPVLGNAYCIFGTCEETDWIGLDEQDNGLYATTVNLTEEGISGLGRYSFDAIACDSLYDPTNVDSDGIPVIGEGRNGHHCVRIEVHGVEEDSRPQCNDGVDNDLDGNIDWPADDGCDSSEDDNEIYVPVCGNGNLDEGEQCDDGNLDNGDGCSSSCMIEEPEESLVKINEFVSDPLEGSVDWVELFNQGNDSVDLENWSLEDSDSNTLSLGGIINPGDLVFFNFSNRLNMDGDAIKLMDPLEALVDVVSYGDEDDGNESDNAPVAYDGDSVGRCPDGYDTDVDIDNFMIQNYPTPGMPNSCDE